MSQVLTSGQAPTISELEEYIEVTTPMLPPVLQRVLLPHEVAALAQADHYPNFILQVLLPALLPLQIKKNASPSLPFPAACPCIMYVMLSLVLAASTTPTARPSPLQVLNPCQSTGLWHIKPTKIGVAFTRAMLRRLFTLPWGWDQTAFQEASEQFMKPPCRPTRLTWENRGGFLRNCKISKILRNWTACVSVSPRSAPGGRCWLWLQLPTWDDYKLGWAGGGGRLGKMLFASLP